MNKHVGSNFPIRYGNYYGPNYTGGEIVSPGERGDFFLKPINATDAAARDHDWRYANADDALAAGRKDISDWIRNDADRIMATALAERIKELEKNQSRTFEDSMELSRAHNAKTIFDKKPLPNLPDPIERFQWERPAPPPLAQDASDGVVKPTIADATNMCYRDAKNSRQAVDPLMLDLDGDGLELKAASGAILFDHNADGIKTGTGWINSDDGILVRDLNGDGAITSGRELFGIDTVKRNGAKAINAFDALADIDSNSDGNFTKADAAWNQVKVWRDLDQDGVSDTGELFTLDALGISRIGTVGSSTNTTGGSQAGTTVNGNFVAHSASFTRNGQTTLTAGAIDLQVSNFHREFTDRVALTAIAKALPTMQGSGRVRDLAQAVSLNTGLATALTAFSSATTRDTQMALIDNLITNWAKSSDFWSSIEDNLGGKDKVNLSITAPAGTTQEQFRNLIGVLEVFNGERFYEKPDSTQTMRVVAGFATSTEASTQGAAIVVRQGYTINPPANQLALLQQSYEALKQSIYGALVLQTRLKPYLDSISLTIGEKEIGFDTSALSAMLARKKQSNEREALFDLVELNRYADKTLQAVGFNGLELFGVWMDAVPDGSALRSEISALGYVLSGTQAGTANNDIFLGGAADESISAGAGNDFVNAGSGNDSVYGGEGNDVLQGGAGNDTLKGDAGNDILIGGAGNDTLEGGADADTLDGGIGNDTLKGGSGNDTYKLAAGSGVDVIDDYDTTAGNVDVVIFDGVASTAVTALERKGNHLVMKYAVSDQLTVEDY
ncbi:hypothetical protein VLK31_35920, partial [Variovorax sp. H27-G14]